MNPQQIKLVQETFAQAAPIATVVAERFYQRLFEIDPSLRSLFHGDIQQQGEKVMTMLATAVHGLKRLDALIPAVRELGQRHAGYGVQAQHYNTVGEALLWALAQSFGPAFTSEVEEAWASAYTLLAGVMQEAATTT